MGTSSVRNRLFQSESFRHAALYAVLSAVSMAVLIAIIYLVLDQSFKSNLLREVDDDIVAITKSYTTAKPRRALHEAKEIIDDRLLAPDENDVFLLMDGSARIAGNLPVLPVRLGVVTLPLPVGALGVAHPHAVLGRGVMLAPNVYAFVGRDLKELQRTEDAVLYAFAGVLLANLVIATVSGVLLSRSFLRRVDMVADTCRGIMAGNLSERIPRSRNADEFERLGDTINDMLGRMQALMESLKQVSTDVAHDLRTPLSHLRQELDRARRKSQSVEEAHAALENGVVECDELLSIFAALLRIAQIEAKARRGGFHDVALKGVVETAQEIFQPSMTDTGHHFSVAAEIVPSIRGDQELLLQLVSNLLDNAIAHTPEGCTITLSCHPIADGVELIIADDGPGIAAGEREKVLRRFYRCERSRTTRGSGLGLALVAAVDDLHHAHLTLEDNAPGLRVRLKFPLREN
jgi:signal transduction histidine kinase